LAITPIRDKKDKGKGTLVNDSRIPFINQNAKPLMGSGERMMAKPLRYSTLKFVITHNRFCVIIK
jgi:hypothetical protein